MLWRGSMASGVGAAVGRRVQSKHILLSLAVGTAIYFILRLAPAGELTALAREDQVRRADELSQPACRQGRTPRDMPVGWASAEMQSSERSLGWMRLDQEDKRLEACRLGNGGHNSGSRGSVKTWALDWKGAIEDWFGVSTVRVAGTEICVDSVSKDVIYRRACVDGYRTSRYCRAAQLHPKQRAPTYADYPSPRCTKAYPFRWRALCCTWHSIERNRTIDQQRHYQAFGTWEIFRQSFHNLRSTAHKYDDLCHLLQRRPSEEVRVLEYGAGIAPGSFRLGGGGFHDADILGGKTACSVPIKSATVVDISGEHLYFGAWRLKNLLLERGMQSSIRVVEADGESLPSLPAQSFDVAIVLTVLEHVPDPLSVMRLILNSLNRPGAIMMDFCAELSTAKAAANPYNSPNLGSSAMLRSQTLAYVNNECTEIFFNKDSGSNHCRPMYFDCSSKQ